MPSPAPGAEKVTFLTSWFAQAEDGGFYQAKATGYAWVALDEPLLGIPDLVQDGGPSYRRIHQFDDRRNTGALRMMENSFDKRIVPSRTNQPSARRTSPSRRNTS